MRDALSTTMRRDLPEWRRRFKLRDKDVEMLRNTLRKFRIKHLPLTDAASHTWNRVQELIGASNERTELSWTYPCGTSPSHTPSFDHQAPYIHFWLRLIGVHEVHSVVVDNAWNQDHAQSEASLAAAKQSVERIVRGFWGLWECAQPSPMTFVETASAYSGKPSSSAATGLFLRETIRNKLISSRDPS